MDKEPDTYPRLGEDPIDVEVYETRSEETAAWAGEGLEDVVLVRASVWGDLDALTGAHGRGEVREVYWLVPTDIYSEITNAEGILKEYLKEPQAGFTGEDLNAMQLEGGCLKGSVRGINMHVCNYTNLPLIEEPVALSLDVSFFPVFADRRSINKLGAVKLLIDSLALRNLQVRHADVTMGVLEGRTRPIHRYIGDAAAEVLKDPEIIASQEPPELWAFRDRAENMFASGQDDELRKYLKEVPDAYADDPAVRLIEASLMARTGRFDEALAEGEAICGEAPEYCAGLQYLGYIAGLEGNEQWKERFMRRAEELAPEGAALPESFSYPGPAMVEEK